MANDNRTQSLLAFVVIIGCFALLAFGSEAIATGVLGVLLLVVGFYFGKVEIKPRGEEHSQDQFNTTICRICEGLRPITRTGCVLTCPSCGNKPYNLLTDGTGRPPEE